MELTNIKMIDKIKELRDRAENKGYNIKGITYKINCFNNIIMSIPRKAKGFINITIFQDGNCCTGFTGTDFKNIEINL